MRYISDAAIFILVSMLLQGCGVFKKVTTDEVTDKQSSSILEQSKLNTSRMSQSSQNFFEWQLDSTNTSDVIMIWPKGRFTFSASHGFEGEAEKIFFKSDVQKSQLGIRVTDSLATEEEHLKLEQKLKIKDEAEVKTTTKKESPAFWPVIAAVLIGVTGMMICKFLIKVF